MADTQQITTTHPEYLIPESVQRNYAEAAAHVALQQDRGLAHVWADQVKAWKASHENEVAERGADVSGYEYLVQWAEKTDPESLLASSFNAEEFRRMRVAESTKRDPERTSVQPAVLVRGAGHATRQAAAVAAAGDSVKDDDERVANTHEAPVVPSRKK